VLGNKFIRQRVESAITACNLWATDSTRYPSKLYLSKKQLDLTTKLFLTFSSLSLLNLGNGYLLVAPLRKKVVEGYQWLPADKFDHLVAKAQLMPGAFSLNLSAIIGREVAGRKGAVISLVATALPLLLLFSLLVGIFSPMRHWSLFESALRGMRPCMIALLAVSAYRMGRAQKYDLTQWLYPISVALIIGFGYLTPLYTIILIAVAGFVYGKYIQPQL
jgi:chromate transporter